ncbi:MAG TPA: DNA polymerase ligase N-terminal domain-containing protein, partial [Candidatus Krumholzibacteria bacterium]|nr:DNA polymerase ligase N-terminal domain-containing protein [Candidatus Krumholzibacteria bacterium]
MRTKKSSPAPRGLEEYQAKRTFESTPEPPPAAVSARSGPLLFVVQQHAARRLHYDFRIEAEGVLKSWAVPKGPSLNPADKRLAIRTEDHPIEYATFTGSIPEGNYGAGEVRMFDTGTYEIVEREGKKLTVRLEGERVRGIYHLVHFEDQ